MIEQRELWGIIAQLPQSVGVVCHTLAWGKLGIAHIHFRLVLVYHYLT